MIQGYYSSTIEILNQRLNPGNDVNIKFVNDMHGQKFYEGQKEKNAALFLLQDTYSVGCMKFGIKSEQNGVVFKKKLNEVTNRLTKSSFFIFKMSSAGYGITRHSIIQLTNFILFSVKITENFNLKKH